MLPRMALTEQMKVSDSWNKRSINLEDWSLSQHSMGEIQEYALDMSPVRHTHTYTGTSSQFWLTDRDWHHCQFPETLLQLKREALIKLQSIKVKASLTSIITPCEGQDFIASPRTCHLHHLSLFLMFITLLSVFIWGNSWLLKRTFNYTQFFMQFLKQTWPWMEEKKGLL